MTGDTSNYMEVAGRAMCFCFSGRALNFFLYLALFRENGLFPSEHWWVKPDCHVFRSIVQTATFVMSSFFAAAAREGSISLSPIFQELVSIASTRLPDPQGVDGRGVCRNESSRETSADIKQLHVSISEQV